MTLFESIESEIKEAMKTGNSTKRDCLRGIVSEIKNRTINAGVELTDDICNSVIKKSVKMHEDSIEQFSKANRNDLVSKEKEEVGYISKFLPSMKSEDETKTIVDKIINDNLIMVSNKAIGMIMRLLPKDVDKSVAMKYIKTLIK